MLWSRNVISRSKAIMYKIIVESIMLYGGEMWMMNIQHQKRLLQTERWMTGDERLGDSGWKE